MSKNYKRSPGLITEWGTGSGGSPISREEMLLMRYCQRADEEAERAIRILSNISRNLRMAEVCRDDHELVDASAEAVIRAAFKGGRV